MPIPLIKDLAEKTNKPVKEIEALYKVAQKQAYDTFNKKSKDFYSYSVEILNTMLGLRETAAVTIKKLNTTTKVPTKTKTEKPPVKVSKKKKVLSIWDIPNSWLLNMSGEASSSAIQAIIYHEASKSLFVNWHSKTNEENFYFYKEVPLSIFVALSKPGVSKGQFIATKVKGKFESEKI